MTIALPLLLAAAALIQPPDPGHGRELPEDAAHLDFLIVNHTGRTIVALAISPRGEESWTGNLLHHREVADGERAAATFSRDVELCYWDVKATFQEGDRRSWPALNLCEQVRIDLR